ncbi:ATP-binding cassette domain-containing protein [Ignisphaera sp. 4213-co]|uniref:ATP-binding cassette domain-containing protein n=1 Tax=Ignisphaera cupida TaxID=3050454 RepID=A0ABD4Z6Q3_9CREN|nr:ATP-binding cassette domain-containing protein [Ignisphaera sp. 4213-co]MDK6029006.1 ATP-binding cassette domain-containing protein [Ignisphaera sp. 4213-co]
MSVLLLKNVSIAVSEKIVLEDVNMSVEKNDVVFLLGPNGAGKTTLLRALVGFPGYNIVSGRIFFEGEDITNTSMETRVSKGIAIAHQIPPKLMGVRVRQLLEALCHKNKCDVYEIADDLGILHLLDREFGKGFSGGELKRVEIATLLAQKPKLALIDEPDSGVDVDSIEIVAKAIKKVIELSPYKSAIIVTHSALISRYIEPTKVCIIASKAIRACNGKELIDEVFKHGFRELA